jgi:hypothetical protein
MKKLIPLVLGVWVVAIVGCTTTTAPTTTTTTTTKKQTTASLNPSVDSTRTTTMSDRGPR